MTSPPVSPGIRRGDAPGRVFTGIPSWRMFELPEPERVAEDTSLVVTIKDTGSITDWMTRVRQLGGTVVGKVEGTQDFWDADALSDRETAIVGSTRLERLWWAPPVARKQPLAVINLNFVYGGRTADRDLWLDTAIAGCETADPLCGLSAPGREVEAPDQTGDPDLRIPATPPRHRADQPFLYASLRGHGPRCSPSSITIRTVRQ